MIKRKIIRIDEALCDGCAQCIPSCPEGALQIIDGKARLVRESYCDGLGACLGQCPQGALSIIEAEVEAFDEESVKNNMAPKTHNNTSNKNQGPHTMHVRNSPHMQKNAGCPSARSMVFTARETLSGETNSKLRQWPLQLHLVPPFAPYFANADLYLIADCVPFAYPNFHNEFLDNHSIAVACPKLDNTEPYVQKIVNIIKVSSIRSITAVVMEVPCCSGFVQIAREAIHKSGSNIPFEVIVIGIQGSILQRTTV